LVEHEEHRSIWFLIFSRYGFAKGLIIWIPKTGEMEILDLYSSINIFAEFNFFSLFHFYNIYFLSCMHFSIWGFLYMLIFSPNVQSHWSVPMVKFFFPSSFCFNLDSCSCLGQNRII
jgi:hypothetical protein